MISIKNLKKSFGDNLVFENVNLDVNRGDAVVIIGGSGCGKSTLLRCINKLEVPNSGQILIDGQDILEKNTDVEAIRKKLGMVYQNFNLFLHLNVMENIVLAPMKVLGLPKKQAIREAEELLEMVGMENRRYHMPQQLSGGQKQRVAIARAMAMKPEIMLFDEPTSALDPTMVDEVENVIRRLISNGMTSITVTHEMRFAKNIASKVIFLAEQGIYEQGSSKDVFENPSRELTRQFLYRSRMLEKSIDKNDTDVYALCSEIKAFAASYGLSARQARGLEYLCDELLLPVIKMSRTGDDKATVRFVAGDNGAEHTVLVDFPFVDTNPLELDCIDELNIRILEGFTEDITTVRNGDGAWEVQVKLK